MEDTGKILTQIYVVSGVCVSVFFLIRGFVSVRKEIEKRHFSSFLVVLLIAATSIVFVVTAYCWTAVISYVF